MKLFLKVLVAAFLAQILLILLLVALIAARVEEKPQVPRGSALIQEIAGPVMDHPVGGLPFPGPTPQTQTDLRENLEKAARDGRIRAVVLRLQSPAVGMAKLDELREGIAEIRRAGKPVWAHTEILDRTALYLGSACDSIFLLPTGFVSLQGMAAEAVFLKGTLDAMGVSPQIDRIGAYKAAAEPFQRDSMSTQARANIEWVLGSRWPAYVAAVEEGRRLDPGSFEGRIAPAAMSPRDALERGLVDRLAYWDEVETSLLALGVEEDDKKDEEGLGPRPRRVSGEDYAKIPRKDAGISGERKIAVVHAQGLIAGEESGAAFPFGATLGAATMEQAFREAAADEDVAGILYRVDSPGGVSSTSWRIQRAALQASKAKPVVVSMGDVAASGGYLIAYPFPMVAGPQSIVGSIGSISGKLNLRGLYDHLGMTKDFVTRGPNALFYSDYHDATPEQWAEFRDVHMREYQEWVADIARYRSMSPAEIDSLGRGRTFTGAQALENGLIDSVGTFRTALSMLRARAGIGAEDDVELLHLPKKAGLLESLQRGGVTLALEWALGQITRPFSAPGTWYLEERRFD
jgi:protease-4